MTGARANLLGGTFRQIAYVTNDFDRALSDFAALGVRRFLELRDIAFMVGEGAVANCHIGLAISGRMEIELIQPLGGADGVYRNVLQGPEFQVHLHHVAQTLPSIDALDAMKAEVGRLGLAIPIDGAAPQGMTYFYADVRPFLGHYVEYTCSTPEFLAGMAAAIPVN